MQQLLLKLGRELLDLLIETGVVDHFGEAVAAVFFPLLDDCLSVHCILAILFLRFKYGPLLFNVIVLLLLGRFLELLRHNKLQEGLF